MKRQFLNITMVVSFLWCVQPQLNAAEAFFDYQDAKQLLSLSEDLATAALLLELGKSTKTPSPVAASSLSTPAAQPVAIFTIFNGYEYIQKKCPICEKVRNLPELSWKKHLKTEQALAIKGLQCPTCKEVYHSSRKLTAHIRTKHQDSSSSCSSFRCSDCHKEFSNSIGLLYHLKRIHQNAYSEFKCGACDTWYKNTDAGEDEHEKTCTGKI